MTKMKSRKMTKSTFAIIIMAVAMVAMLAFGGTYAYFTATTAAKATTGLTTAKVSLKANQIAQAEVDKVTPGTVVVTNVSYTNESDIETWVFVKLTAKIGESGKEVEAPSVLTINYDTNNWTAVDEANGIYRSTKVVAAGTALPFLLTSGDNVGIKFDADVNYDEGKYDNKGDGDYMSKSIVVTFQTAAVQGDISAELAKDQVQWPTAE